MSDERPTFLSNPPRVTRKTFVRRALAAGAAAIASRWVGGQNAVAATTPAPFTHDFEAVIVGSGFGGSVTAARLGRAWPGRVLVVERGRRYPKGSFPRTPGALTAALRRNTGDNAPRPIDLPGTSNGLIDLRSFDGIDVLVANGVGGGSLIYGAAIIEPSNPSFDRHWPKTIKKGELAPYFNIFRDVIGARTVPLNGDPRRHLPRLGYYQRIAEATGAESKPVPIGVFFGNDPKAPTEPGQEEVNRHGAVQASCTYCAECVIGCNQHAKSSMDLNYLFVAENRYGVEVRVEKLVDRVVPLTKDGREAPTESGAFGYRVYLRDARGGDSVTSVTARRVVLSAGTLGTTEILLRNRDVHRTLGRVSRALGRRFSPNGDFLGFVVGGAEEDGNAYGPTVVQTIRYDNARNPSESHVLEDMSLPAFGTLVDWLLDIATPGGPWHGAWSLLKGALANQVGRGPNAGFSTSVFVGLDASDGELSLGRSGELHARWSYWRSRGLYDAIIQRIDDARRAVHGVASGYLPTYVWPLRRNLTVHPLGGCSLADNARDGVTSAGRNDFGAVFGYANLYVADGSLIPSALGANPSLTIAAFAEMVSEGITGRPATTDL